MGRWYDSNVTDPEFNKALAAWLPPVPKPGDYYFGIDRTQPAERLTKPAPPWRWYHFAIYRVGLWLENLGLRMQGWVP